MNVPEMIRDLFCSQGCAVEEDFRSGIWTIRTPDGEVWDFTAPQRVEEPEHREEVV